MRVAVLTGHEPSASMFSLIREVARAGVPASMGRKLPEGLGVLRISGGTRCICVFSVFIFAMFANIASKATLNPDSLGANPRTHCAMTEPIICDAHEL